MGIQKLSSNELARLCAVRGGSEEWLEFVQRFTRPIALSAYRVARLWGDSSATVVDDIVQDVFLKFCEDDNKILRDFDPRHPDSFLAFAKVVAAATANDYFRKRYSAKRGGGTGEDPLNDMHSERFPGSRQSAEWMERNLLLLEIDRLLKTSGQTATGTRDRTVFWLYYQQGMTAGAIAALPGIGLSVKGVESALHRMTALIRSHLRRTSVTSVQKNSAHLEGFPVAPAVQKGKWL